MAPIPIKLNDVDHRAVRKSLSNVVHLEDNTPVRTVKVTNFPENVTSEYLQGYFEHASGPIENVSMVHESNDACEKIAAFYITFKVPEDAAKLICDTSSNCNFKFTVKQAEDIHQPKIDSNACKLVDINDDCLLHIISYLPILDVVNLSKTCVLLSDVTKSRFNKFKHFLCDAKTDESINESTLPSILKCIGSYIRSLEIYDLSENILVALSEHCLEIHTMKIINPSRKLQWSSFKNKELFFKNLECLEIRNSGLFDNSLKTICSSLKVTCLTLIQCRNIRGTFLAKLKNLKVLKLLDLDASSGFSLQCGNHPIFKTNYQLTVFGIDYCGCSYIHFLQRTESLQEIQELQLDFSMFWKDVSQLANLECLTKLTKFTITRKFDTNYVNFDNILLILSNSSKSLESFDVQRIEIGNSTLQYLGRMKNLKRLRLENIRSTIGDRLYNDLPTHQPSLRDLTINLLPYGNPIASNSSQCICNMITSLQDLEYFSHSGISLELISLIQKNLQQAGRQSLIKIGVPQFINDDLKKQFIAATKDMITPRITITKHEQFIQ